MKAFCSGNGYFGNNGDRSHKRKQSVHNECDVDKNDDRVDSATCMFY